MEESKISGGSGKISVAKGGSEKEKGLLEVKVQMTYLVLVVELVLKVEKNRRR